MKELLFFLNQGYGNDWEFFILVIAAVLLMFSPAIIMVIIGFVLRKKKPKTAKTLFITAGVYLVIGIGMCTLWE